MNKTQNHDGDGDASALEKILLGHEMYPATVRQILALNLDEATVIASVDHLLGSGWGIGAIADRLRRSPPDKGQPYERQRSAQPSDAPAPRKPSERIRDRPAVPAGLKLVNSAEWTKTDRSE